MRLFVAVEIAPHVRDAADDLIRECRIRAQRLAPRAKVTWVAAERLHLTLRFIGQAAAPVAEQVRSVLEPSFVVASFDLTVARTGTFPATGPPRVVWAGVSSAGDALLELEQEATQRLAQVGIGPEDRPYRPHLTLARVREPAGLRGSTLLQGLEDVTLGTTRVEAITLFESRLSPHGPTYVPLLRTLLGRRT